MTWAWIQTLRSSVSIARFTRSGSRSPAVFRMRSHPTIAFIGDRAEFTPPVLFSKDNRSKLVYLVEAKPSAQDALKLHPGQPVDVTLPP